MMKRHLMREKNLMADDDFISVDKFDAFVHGAVDNVEVIETQEQVDEIRGDRRSHHKDRQWNSN